MKLLVLAAGYAVRLQPLTTNTPKPLLPIGGKSMMDRILAKTETIKNIDAIYVVSNGRFFQNFVEWKKARKDASKIFLVDDGTMTNDTRLGAIRDMELAIREASIDDDLLVIAGDNLFDLDLAKFLKFANSHGDGVSVALHDVGSLEAAKKFGVVRIDGKGIVTDFEEKPQAPKSTLISTGIYFFPGEKAAGLSEYVNLPGAKLDAPGHYIRWLSANDKVYGFPFSEKWYDIGDLESYKRADEEYTKNPAA
jgi:Nucleoside-diphosphate-sugar pyrophosphorylase involved in lipopolysaccharide biosynthesis/translation initiation factor 2B, gamma/epsilon subunits (eIF-2Bgamma/eIF-2Bepsilon)